MLRQFIFEITFCGIRFQFRKDVPDSGQEHPAHSDDRLFVPTVSLDSAIAFPALGIFAGFDDGVGNLDQQGFQVTSCPGDAGGFHFLVALVITGQQPAQETRCFAEGNTDISTPISEMRARAVNGAAEKPGTMRISSSWYG